MKQLFWSLANHVAFAMFGMGSSVYLWTLRKWSDTIDWQDQCTSTGRIEHDEN